MRHYLLAALLLINVLASAQSLKVGIYQNPPLIIIDQQGNPSGFCIDLLQEIANKNAWNLKFEKYEFAEGLQALEEGTIDILPAMAYSLHRDSVFVLNETSVITNWGKLYKSVDDDNIYPSLEELRGKKIAVLENDYYYQNGEDGLKDLVDELDIPLEIIVGQSYNDVINRVRNGEAQLGLVSRYFGVLETEGKGVIKTPINLAYVSVRYGFSSTDSSALLVQKLDEALNQLINDRSSIYYRSEEKYLANTPQLSIPLWFWRTLGIILMAIFALFLFIILLQYQVKKKTKNLKDLNIELGRSEREARLAVKTIEASQDIGFWFRRDEPFIRVNQAAITLTGYSKEELLKMKPSDLLASEVNKPYYDSLEEGKWDGHLRIHDSFKSKDGSIFPVELSLDEFQLDGQTYIGGFARNISARVKAERDLLERNKELNCLYEISKLIAHRTNTVEDIFKGVLKVIPAAWQHISITKAKISYRGKDYLSVDYKECPWFLNSLIFSGGAEVGEVIVGYSKSMPEEDEGPFLEEEVDLINAIGKELGNMLDSREADRRVISSILSTEDNERSRISKELHDSVGQSLSAISINLDSIGKSKTLTEKEREKLKNIDELVKDAISESRSVSHNLMPPALTDLGYVYAVENLLNAIELSSETKFSFQSNESTVEVAKEIQFALFRITQEAINNIIKYAVAPEATIQYLIFEDLISLSIEDNGQGFDINIVDKNHNFGLNSMRNRAASIGAEITIDSSPNKGTGVHVSLVLT